MNKKYFIEEKEYKDDYIYSEGRTKINENFIIKFYPAGSMILSRKYYTSYNNDNHYYDEFTEVENSFIGDYEIKSIENEMTVISIHLTQETTKCLETDGYEGKKPDIFYENKSVDINFDMIERVGRKRIGFTEKNIFKNFDDKPDNIYFKGYIDFCQNEGLILSETEIIDAMKEYDCNIMKWLIVKFPEYKLEEKVEYLLKNDGIFNEYGDYEKKLYCLRLAGVDGDISGFLDKYHYKGFKELREILKSQGIEDLDTAFKLFNAVESKWESGDYYYKYSKRNELYGEQNEVLKNKYGMNDESSNFDYLIRFNADLKKIFEVKSDKKLYYMDELKKLEGFNNETKNEEILQEIPFGLTFDDLDSFFKVYYDNSVFEQFKKLKKFLVYPNKNSLDNYNKANGDIYITSILVNSPGYFEAFGDKISSEVLAYALLSDETHYITIDEFKSYLAETIKYFHSKNVIISETDLIRYLAFVKPSDSKSISPSDLYYKFHLKIENYYRKNNYIKKYAKNFQNDYENIKCLYREKGIINDYYFEYPPYDYSEEEKILKDFEKIYDPQQLEDFEIWTFLKSYAWQTDDKKRENINFILDKKLNLDDHKRISFFSLCNRSDNHQEIYSILVDKDWNLNWVYLYLEYPEIYDTFKNKTVDGNALYQTAYSCNGEISKVNEVFGEIQNKNNTT